MRQPRQRLEEQWHHFTVNTTAEGSPAITHSTWYRGAQGKFPCFAGWALPPLRAKRLDQSLPLEIMTNPSALTGTLLRNRSRDVTCLGLFFWGGSGNLHFIPLSHCLQWHLWALHLIPLSFALDTEFCWSFTYFVGSEGVPHDHLPILNESTEKEKLRLSRDVAASLLPSLEKTLLLISSPQSVMSFCLHLNNSTVVTVKHQGDTSQ